MLEMFTSLTSTINSVLPSAEKVMAAAGSLVGAVWAFAFGDITVIFYGLLAFAGLDLLTGCVGAARHGEFTTHRCYIGINKKIVMILFVVLAKVVDQAFDTLLHYQLFQSIIICAYMLGEMTSIIENFEKCGLEGVVPPVIKRMLAVFNRKLETTVETIAEDESHDRSRHPKL